MMYVVEGDSTGKRIWAEEEIGNYFRLARQDPDTQILTKLQANDIQGIQILKQLCKSELDMIEKKIPKSIDTITRTSLHKEEPQLQRFVYRHFAKYGRFDKEARARIEADLDSIAKFEERVGLKRRQNQIESIPAKLSDQVFR